MVAGIERIDGHGDGSLDFTSMIDSVAVIGTGPAALMCATVLGQHGFQVTLFEKKRGPGKKLLIAGCSGLNISNAAPFEEFVSHYKRQKNFVCSSLEKFSPQDWLRFIESLGIETFLGTSRRYFTKNLKAAPLLHAWIKKLKSQGARFFYATEVMDFERTNDGKIVLRFSCRPEQIFSAVCFCLGGASYPDKNEKIDWPQIFKNKKISFEEFSASNVGYEVNWPQVFLNEAEGLPLKNILLRNSLGEMGGDLVVTSYGLEGTPIYAIGTSGLASLDLKPDLGEKEILEKIQKTKENLAPFRRVKKYLNLSPAALALLFHLTDEETKNDSFKLTKHLKNFPLKFLQPRPVAEAISSAGGIDCDELDGNFMLKKIPGVFVAGEMLNWDAPTGGFLIQACVSQGFCAGQGIERYLSQYT